MTRRCDAPTRAAAKHASWYPSTSRYSTRGALLAPLAVTNEKTSHAHRHRRINAHATTVATRRWHNRVARKTRRIFASRAHGAQRQAYVNAQTTTRVARRASSLRIISIIAAAVSATGVNNAAARISYLPTLLTAEYHHHRNARSDASRWQ